MGKRKRATKPPPKKKSAKLEKVFDCRYCGHEKSVDCTIEREHSSGTIECRVCGAKFSASINHLEEEIDLYAKWIDAADNVNAQQEAQAQQEEIFEEEAQYTKKGEEQDDDVREDGKRRNEIDLRQAVEEYADDDEEDD